MVGTYSKKFLYSHILCRLYCICYQANKLNKKFKKHDCIKNWSGSSKRMEAQAILDIAIKYPHFFKFVAYWIIRNDDSFMRVVLCHPCLPVSKNTKYKDQLPTYIIEPKFKADPIY